MLEYSREIAASKDLTTLRDSLVRYVSQAERVLSDLYNVAGDGITDDTVALNAALAAGGFIELTEAVYIITDDLLVSVNGTVIYSNVGSEIRQISSNKNGLKITASNVTIDGIKLTGVQYVLSKDEFAIYAYGADSSHYLSGLTVRHCTIDTWGFYGIQMVYVQDFSIQNNDVSNIYYGAIMGSSVKRGDIEGNRIYNVVGAVNAYGIEVTRASTDSLATDPRSSDVCIHDNVARTIPTWKAYGTHGGQRISFVNNKSYGCLYGIGVGGAANASGVVTWAPIECSIIGNELNSGVVNGSAIYGIFFTGALESTTVHQRATGTIQGNTVEGYGQDVALGTAIYCHTSQGLVIDGNTILEPSRAGIFGTTENRAMKISNNTIINPWTETGTCYGVRFNDINNTAFIDGNIITTDSDRWAELGRVAPVSALDVGIICANAAGNTIRIGDNYCTAPTYLSDAGFKMLRGDWGGAITVTTGEDTLSSQVIPASYLGIGSRLRIVCAGDITGVLDTKKIKFYFGTWSVQFYATANHNDYWRFEADIVCDASASQKISWKGYDGIIVTQGYADGAESMAAAITVKCTGECTNGGDTIIQEFMDIRID